MRRICKDQTGADWDISWGVLDGEASLRNEFAVVGPYESTDQNATFQDPIYRYETKTLAVYQSAEGRTVAMAEITPSMFAAGVKL